MKEGHGFYLTIEEAITVFKKNKRMKVFRDKGVECSNPFCDRKGEIAKVTPNNQHPEGKPFVNIYAQDGMLMTVDHWIPVAKGGTDALSNLVPMCRGCNALKQDHFIGTEGFTQRGDLHKSKTKKKKELVRYARRWRKVVRRITSFEFFTGYLVMIQKLTLVELRAGDHEKNQYHS